MSASDEEARCQRLRVCASSAASTVAVNRRAPDGATTSKAEEVDTVDPPSNRSAIDTGAIGPKYRKASVRSLDADSRARDRSAATDPTRMPLGSSTGVT